MTELFERLKLRYRRWRYSARTCESCGAPADAILRDKSTWCSACHGGAITNGYDLDFGRPIR